jgi:ADP-dependent NAD(P)H-hydrate dehydratase / NAD(P)H-hydrate epimerase
MKNTIVALYSVAKIRAIEQAAAIDLKPGTLMRRAGQAAAKAIISHLSNDADNARILVLAGPGDNGGDGLETASCLKQVGFRVTVLLYADPAKQSADAQQALLRAQNNAVHFADPTALSSLDAIGWTLIVDALFGLGLTRPIDGKMRDAVEYINTLACPILALDIPSGLNADTGDIAGGAHGIAVHASHTMTFIADKPGLHTCHAMDYTGNVQIADLAIEERYFKEATAHLNGVPLFSGAMQRRLHHSHKGSYGDITLIGGAHGMHGALVLAARAAAQCGAGRVFAAFVDAAPTYDSTQPELMCRLADMLDFSSSTVVIGPGLGTSDAAHTLLTKTLTMHMPLVIDADALNLIAAAPALQQLLLQRMGNVIMTPHPLEAARLLATSSSDVQTNRLAAARQLASQFNAIIVLKGSGTVIAHQDGNVVVNPTGNPGLATAGTGDVLAGICGALLAQEWPAWETALAGVWLHGRAADRLVEQGTGPIGMTAGELIPHVRSLLNQLTNDHDPHRFTDGQLRHG